MKSIRIACIAAWTIGLAGLAGAQEIPKHPKPPRAFVWKGMAGGGYLGVQVQSLTPELRAHFGAPDDAGVLVARVDDGSPAAAAGILVGDVITSVDGKPVERPSSLARAVRAKKAGDSVSVDFVRDKGTLSASVAVQERDRTVVDLADFEVEIPEIAPFPGDGPLVGGHGFVFAGPEGAIDLNEDAVRAFEDAMKDIEDRFESEEWQEKLKRFSELDFSKIQERMKEVEERLRKLEKDLDQEGKKKP